MNRKRRRFVRAILLALAVTAVLAPATSAADMRSPDTRDAALAAEPSSTLSDLRSPDTRDTSRGTQPVATVVDLRSPDSRDAVRGYRPGPAIEVVRAVGPSGFDWRDAGIGALAAFAIALVAVGTMLAGLRHRRSKLAAV